MPSKTKSKKRFPTHVSPHLSTQFISELCDFSDSLVEVAPSLRHSLLRQSLLAKYCDRSTTPASVRRSAAFEKFFAMEKRNSVTNVRLFTAQGSDEPFEKMINRVLNRAQRYISRLIGDEPVVEWNFQTTNGASTRIKRSEVAAYLKYEGKAQITEDALPLWLDAIQDTIFEDVEGLVYPDFVDGSELFTVPKSSDIDRVAAKEPELNMLLQRSIGLCLRRHLLRVGINLRDQGRNQQAAKEGSISGRLVTIDLSSASDTISHEVVRRVLPSAWFELLDTVRSKVTSYNGQVVPLQMFSSMGNGFTFELETMIFWSLACSCRAELSLKSGTTIVYGDDIILEKPLTGFFLNVLSFLGFIPNWKKTHISGTYRESCGKHWDNGMDVTPMFIRSPVTHITQLIHLLNQFRVWATKDPVGLYQSGAYELWSRWSRRIPSFLRGWDPHSTGSLLTLGRPRKVLQPVFKEVSIPSKGAYLWTMGTRHTLIEPPEVDPRIPVDWVVRPSRHADWYEGPAPFIEEL